MSKKWMKNLFGCSLAAGMFLISACGVSNGETSSSSSSSESSDSSVETPVTPEVDLRVAYAEDKILQSYAGTSSMEAFGERFENYLMDDFSISAFRNEYESRQIIIRPNVDIESYDVTVSDFTCDGNVLPASAFDLRHEYYHEVTTIMSTESTMQPGMYPDAMLPLSAAKEYKINKIKANENQGVLVTVKVPKDQAVGTYTGTFTVKTDGTTQTMNATVEVLDYTVPEEVTVKSCMQVSSGHLAYLEAEVTQERYDKIVDSLKDFRLGVQWLYGMTVDTTRDEVVQQVADAQVEYMLKAAQDPAVPSYGLTTNGKVHSYYGAVLKTEWFMIYLKTYVEASVEHNVDLFKKAYVYMGSIIDEPEGWGQIAMERVDYVCTQLEECLTEAAEYAESLGGSQELIQSILNLSHVVTTRIDSPANYQKVDTYCTEPQYYDSSAKVDDYREHRENGGDYWLYTCCNPKTPYPTLHIDDNGVSARVMYWMMRDYDMTGFLMWETIGTGDGFPDHANSKPLHGIEQYEDVMRNNTDVGDGYYYYPGKVFGLDNSVPSIRLFYMRDGAEDYDVITDLENRLYPALSTEYEAAIDGTGILNELYGSMYLLNQVYCTSGDIATAKDVLNKLMVWAEDGVAISDYQVAANGNVTAKIYAPQGVEVKINGKVATGVASGKGLVYEVNEKSSVFQLEIGGETLTWGCEATNIFEIDADKVSFLDEMQNVVENVPVAAHKYEGTVDTLKIDVTETVHTMAYALEDGALTADSESLFVYVYLDAPEKIQMSLNVRGKVKRIVDSVYVHPGYNVLRFDRLCDLEWKKIKDATSLQFSFQRPESVTTFTLNVQAINVVN